MEQSLRLYLEQAASVKKLVNRQMWNFCGLRWSLARLDVVIYYALVTLIFVFKVAISFVEDFPGGVVKPGEVWWMDLGSSIADLIFVICLSFKPDIFPVWHGCTGLTGFASKVGRAYMIAAYTTPLTPISSHRDRFNALAPAMVTGMKGVLALMALPSEKLPLSRAGEPFAPLANCGKGLSNADRCKLLGAILSSMCESFLLGTSINSLLKVPVARLMHKPLAWEFILATQILRS